MENPYQPPTISRSKAECGRGWIAYLPFWIAAAAIVAGVVLWFLNPDPGEPAAIALAVVGTVLVFALPVCLILLVAWWKTGELHELSLVHLLQTREERDFHRKLQTRPQLDEEAFYESFYVDSGVPNRSVTQLRKLLEDVSGHDLLGLNPYDNLLHLDDDLDFADVLWRIERDFKIKLDWEELQRIDLTFDSLLRATLRRMAASEVTQGTGATNTDV